MTSNPAFLEDKTVIITGGSSGIGRAAALDIARQGANVLITGRRRQPLDEVAQAEGIVALVADSAQASSATRPSFDSVSWAVLFAWRAGPGTTA